MFLAFLLATALSYTPPPSINAIYLAESTPRATGVAIGASQALRTKTSLSTSHWLQKVAIPWLHGSQDATDLYDSWVAANKRAYPDHYAELEGLAIGIDVPLEWLLLSAFESEIAVLLSSSQDPYIHKLANARRRQLACTDVLLYSPQGPLLAHNEDEGMDLVDVMIAHAQLGSEVWWSLIYPGSLGGWAWNIVESAGVGISFNALFPKDVVKGGLAVAFINRDVLSGSSVDDVVGRAKVANAALGFSMNVVSADRLVNVEVAGHNKSSVVELHLNDPPMFHANLYLHLDVEQHSDPSSTHRMNRWKEFAPPTTAHEMLAFLGDTKDSQYPVYRNGNPPDEAATLTTTLFDWSSRHNVYRGNPKSTSPVAML